MKVNKGNELPAFYAMDICHFVFIEIIQLSTILAF